RGGGGARGGGGGGWGGGGAVDPPPGAPGGPRAPPPLHLAAGVPQRGAQAGARGTPVQDQRALAQPRDLLGDPPGVRVPFAGEDQDHEGSARFQRRRYAASTAAYFEAAGITGVLGRLANANGACPAVAAVRRARASCTASSRAFDRSVTSTGTARREDAPACSGSCSVTCWMSAARKSRHTPRTSTRTTPGGAATRNPATVAGRMPPLPTSGSESHQSASTPMSDVDSGIRRRDHDVFIRLEAVKPIVGRIRGPGRDRCGLGMAVGPRVGLGGS